MTNTECTGRQEAQEQDRYRLLSIHEAVATDLDDLAQYDDYMSTVGRTCSICDAVGHGYPGGGPCPLEERGEDCPPWAM